MNIKDVLTEIERLKLTRKRTDKVGNNFKVITEFKLKEDEDDGVSYIESETYIERGYIYEVGEVGYLNDYKRDAEHTITGQYDRETHREVSSDYVEELFEEVIQLAKENMDKLEGEYLESNRNSDKMLQGILTKEAKKQGLDYVYLEN